MMHTRAPAGVSQRTLRRSCGEAHGVTATRLRKPVSMHASADPTALSVSKDTIQLGKSGLMVPSIGVGAWSWGDRSGYWGYGEGAGAEYGKEESRQAFKALLEAGLTFIDTAEVYGFGKSEEFLGEFIREAGEAGKAVQVATKFAPQPWRLTADSVPNALKASLKRLGKDRCELYMQHWPGFFLNAFSNDTYMEGLIRCKQQGLCDALGVSNFTAKRVRETSTRLQQEGIPLASNQVQYSLLYRTPEKSGVLEACKETGTTLVAYSPLCQGLLTGKYQPGGAKPYGPRKALFNDGRLREVQPVLNALKAVADERGKSMAQVAINWTICKGTLPIPGAKNAKQLTELAGASGWRLTDGEMRELDAASDRVPASMGAPFENW
eukprot:CAMPEP_0119107180 /NCGR_PEP_ID=MMETSP1180-20130426/8975_1 /TAXON_ID=3052 ORGANISM="Chlamydomonas cf sp, Strain CCMP681" /NCGR_SAMPLE_ID=MMETSP1180 /ASSEMBLY_ACC=CAM_ASM_000741 /LENGTH=379 /DNA_ID=CAMNT_0007092633 /DNA_START=5 /DNA_END=1144 /DNA_ORIENTATION=+